MTYVMLPLHHRSQQLNNRGNKIEHGFCVSFAMNKQLYITTIYSNGLMVITIYNTRRMHHLHPCVSAIFCHVTDFAPFRAARPRRAAAPWHGLRGCTKLHLHP